MSFSVFYEKKKKTILAKSSISHSNETKQLWEDFQFIQVHNKWTLRLRWNSTRDY